MNIGKAASALWEKAEDAVPQIKAASWTSSSMGILLIIAALMVAAYLGHELLSDANMNRLTILAGIYMIVNAIPKAIETYWNGKIRHTDWTLPDDPPKAPPKAP
jgi:hypothetical protein